MRLIFPEKARLPFFGAAAALVVAAAMGAEPGEALEDVQMGERGDILRVALICTTRCDVAPGEDVSFHINGVAARLDIDVSSRSALARRLTIAPDGAGSVLTLDAARRVNSARIVDCRSDSGPAPCIEYRFEPGGALAAAKPPPAAATRAARDDIPFIGAVILAPNPTLRDEPASGIIHLPDFAPPERLAPPAQENGAAREKSRVDVGRPALIAIDRAEALSAGAGFDIKSEAAAILGKSFSIGACEGAKARLMADAWALEAMIDFAFCKAGEGRLEEADADFARLLAYTPDNYEALVGRGLIAIAGGEREKGLAFYQDALNALPPIAESDRIVEAMERS